jgi:hypothetical protein
MTAEAVYPDSQSSNKIAVSIGNFAKSINAVIILVLGAFGTALADGNGVNTVEWWMIILAFLGGLANLAVPLKYRVLNSYGKLAVTALAAGVTQVISAYQDGGGIVGSEWVTVLITFFSAITSVYVSPNAAKSDALRITSGGSKFVNGV